MIIKNLKPGLTEIELNSLEKKSDTGPIAKDLLKESQIQDVVAYYPIRGASKVENFESPDSYVFLLFEKSSGTHTIDCEIYEQKNLQIHISFPKQTHSWNTGPDAIGHKLIVDKKFIEQSEFGLQLSAIWSNKFPVIDISASTYERLSMEFLAIEHDLQIADQSFKWSLIKQRLHVIVMFINYLIAKRTDENKNWSVDNKNKKILIGFSKLLEENFKNAKSVSHYAELLNVSANYLNVLCRKQLNLTAKEVISHRLILEAKRLLKTSDIRVKELAYELGFSELGNFTTFFKKYTGYTPGQLRQNKLISTLLVINAINYL